VLESLGEAPQLPDAHSSTFHSPGPEAAGARHALRGWNGRGPATYLRGTNRASTFQTWRNIQRNPQDFGIDAS